MSDYPMLISNKLHSFRNFMVANIQRISLYANKIIVFSDEKLNFMRVEH